MSRQQYNASFLHTLELLNTQQRKAVEQIEGPVLVLAGPGTGKTHILSARIGRILLETDAQAHNILCLTFTDAGVHAMRNRLIEFIGPEAHRVHIYTFHSFCNTIIQDNLERFGRHDLEPLSDLERVELTRRIIDELAFDHPLKKGRNDVYFFERHLQDLFQRMKSEVWTVANIQQKIDAYLNDLPLRDEYIYQRNSGENKKGDLKTAKLADITDKMKRLSAAVALFPKYEHALRELHRYDYEDMILWVLKAFEEHPYLLRTYQEQYLYFLVDEYQDTNGAQNKILQALIKYWENPNVFIVGDDDQSIYEFQGARLKNLTDFYGDYEEHLKLVLLEDNYRSSQQILDSSKTLILQNQKRLLNSLAHLGLSKNLKARHPEFSLSKVLPKIIAYKNKIQEDTDIVTQIAALQAEGFPLNEVAIIYAKHKQAENIIRLMERKSIPYNTKRRVNILNEPLIQNLRTLLEYIDLEHHHPYSGEHLIFQILHFDFWQIEQQDIVQLSLFLNKKPWLDRPAWRALIGNKKQLQQFNLKYPDRILKVSELIDLLTKDYVNFSLPRLLEILINQSGLMAFTIQHEQKIWRTQLLKTFFDFVKLETDRRPRLNIQKFLEMLQNMEANNLRIELNRTVYNEKGVNLITAHSSKGLEFHTVFIIDTLKDQWEPRRTSRNRFVYPDTLTLSGEEDALEARRRLFYVAMTRAKERLQISFSQFTTAEKPQQSTQFIDELLAHPSLQIEERTLSSEALLESELLLLLETQKPNINLPDTDTINAMLEGFSMSVSALNRYLKCPLSFYYEYILRVPSLMSPAAAYGTAMHYALMKLFEKMQQIKEKVFPNSAQFISFFEKEMERQRVYFTPKEYSYRLERGKQTLAQYYSQYISSWPKNVKVEYEIRQVEVDGVPIKGVIDRVDILNDFAAHIEDYKTGNMTAAKTRKPTEKNPLGGNYYRQLVFYKILFEHALPHKQRIKTGAIAYLETDKTGQFPTKSIRLTEDDTQFVRGLIRDTWNNIQAHQFSEGCGERNCVWCDFIKNNQTPASFVETEIEELDD